MEENIANEILSDITVHMKYARYLPKKKRRENWKETVARNQKMHTKKFIMNCWEHHHQER